MKRTHWLTLAVLAVVIGTSGCGSGAHTATKPTRRAVAQLHSVSQLRNTFDAHPGEPRLILLISPT
jgi:hypothetical protein